MKRAVVALPLLIIAGAAVWSLVTYGPQLRWYIRVRWRAIEVSHHEPAAEEAWRQEFGDPASTLDALPAHGDNAIAVRLVELGPGAGVNVSGSSESSPSLSAIAIYVNAESMKTGGRVDPPTEVVGSYLNAHKAGLDAVVELLAQAEPSWRTEKWPMPSPTPLLGLRHLSNVLVARALAESAGGRDEDAERALLAAWHLSASLRERPLLIEQLMVAPMTTNPAILPRLLTVNAAAWRVRFGEYDPRADMMRAMVIEASRKWAADTSQLARASRADYLDLMRASLLQLRDLPITSQPTIGFSADDAIRDGWSAGAMTAEIARPGLDGAWLSADLVMLQLELTDRVLHARQLKAQLGRWPATIPNVETSRIAGAHWVYGVGSDGRMSIAVTPTLQGPPLRFESRD